MSKENPTVPDFKPLPSEKSLASLSLADMFLKQAIHEATAWPGWQATFTDLQQRTEQTVTEFKRWQEQQAKGGAL